MFVNVCVWHYGMVDMSVYVCCTFAFRLHVLQITMVYLLFYVKNILHAHQFIGCNVVYAARV